MVAVAVFGPTEPAVPERLLIPEIVGEALFTVMVIGLVAVTLSVLVNESVGLSCRQP